MATDKDYLPLPGTARQQKQSRVSGRRNSRRLFALLLLCLASIFVYVHRNDGSLFRVKEMIKGMTPQGTLHLAPVAVKETDDGARIGKALQGNAHDAAASEHVDITFRPTDALRKLAGASNQPIPASADELEGGPLIVSLTTRKPSKSDHVLLMLDALKNSAYTVPLDATQRAAELLPESVLAFTDAVKRVSRESLADARLYVDQHDMWTAKHRRQSPLTVFSKSYCPFSRRAKALLTKMGASFDIYEVDLRPDAEQLQLALADLSGHRTFPTIFVRDQLIGGSDDLLQLDNTGVLRGILEGAGVEFRTPTST